MTNRDFAVEVVQRLQVAGHQALFAGGCVRDQLLGLVPKDYDVATNARPEQVRELFGKHRTLAIGASFGVISVIGPKPLLPIEVATFRRDGSYSDGRRPDHVEFTDAREDALRRDFTINGLFFDPIADRVLDFVDGRRDLDERVIRAIGNPADRISEDKLRMLRAIRFTATFDFELERETKDAIRKHARQISVVSGERIGAEMRRMLGHSNRHLAAQLLQECELLEQIVPSGNLEGENRANWRTRLKWLKELGAVNWETAAVVLLLNSLKEQGVEPIAERWKLSTAERKSIAWINQHWLTLSRAAYLPWSEVQPFLVHGEALQALKLAETALGPNHVGVEFCREKLKLPAAVLNPKELANGEDLKSWGLEPGPTYSRILSIIRTKQLDGEISSKQQAHQIALEFLDAVD